MNEFQNRMEAQRQILQLVNRSEQKEELFGLSSKAIERWTRANAVDANSTIVALLKAASGKLFFLANKSQEQISEDYRTASREIHELTRSIEAALGS
jgi:hypothetical protein